VASADVTTDTTRSCSAAVISWNSGKISECAVSRSVTGRHGLAPGSTVPA
jgi:hypothetical protein